MNNLRLFIANTEVELNEKVTFAITKQFEDLNNPTKIINDWSKTIKIPFTTKNNKLFGNIYNVDRKIVVGSGTIGISFDPTKKVDFRLEHNSNIIMTGYMKMNSITKEKGFGYYNVTLNGKLGKTFQTLKNLSFNKEDKGTDNYIDATKYFNAQINKQFVINSFNKYVENRYSTIEDVMSHSDGVYSMIGVTPVHSGLPKNYDSKSIQTDYATHKSYEDSLKDYQQFSRWGITPDTFVKDGFNWYQSNQIRSYNTQPYMYVDMLFNMMKYEAAQRGITLDYDTEWFNSDNEYYNNLIFLLNSFQDNGIPYDFKNEYIKTLPNYGISLGSWYSSDTQQERLYNSILPATTYNEERTLLDSTHNYFDFSSVNKAEMYCLLKNLSLVVKNISSGTKIRFNPLNYLRIGLELVTSSGSPRVIQDEWILKDSECTLISGENVINVPAFTPDISTNIGKIISDLILTMTIENNVGPISGVKPAIRLSWYDETPDYRVCKFIGQDPGSSTWVTKQSATLTVKADDVIIDIISNTETIRTNTRFTLNNIWDNKYKPFDIMLNYCKMFRILIIEENGVVKFIPANKYFTDYTIEDYTDKLDMSKDFIISPILNDNQKIVFNYSDDSKIGLNEQYKKQFGVNFGEKIINTNYNFNTEKLNLFENINCSIGSSENYFNYYDLTGVSDYPIRFSGWYSFPCLKDENNNSISNFGAFFFRWSGNGVSTNNLNYAQMRLYITDDTAHQIYTNIYCDIAINNEMESQGYIEAVSRMPGICMWDASDEPFKYIVCTFGAPKQSYDSNITDYVEMIKSDIYTVFWRKYLNELYDVNTKKVTCYLKMNISDFNSFKFNKFIKINNTLYFINKIYDYSISEYNTTKVDLITVNDIKNYTDLGWDLDALNYYINVNKSSIRFTTAGQTTTFKISSNAKWVIKMEDSLSGNVKLDTLFGEGDATVTVSLVNVVQGTTKINIITNNETKTINVTVGS